MRNLKKFLALVLAMVMAFSLMLSASAADVKYDDYKDKDSVTAEFEEAVQVLTGLKVVQGDGEEGNKSFRPSDKITRAEAAAIIYRVVTGDVTDRQTDLYKDYSTFKDVKSDDWFAGYVGYCQNAGYIKGHAGYFTPYGQVTGYEVLAMILRAVGYGKNNEFSGSSWQVNVASLSKQLGVTADVVAAHMDQTLNMAAPREVVADLVFMTMATVPTVTYTPALAYNDKDSILGGVYNPTLGQKVFGLYYQTAWYISDDWGRPGYAWYDNGAWDGKTTTTIANGKAYMVKENHPVYTATNNSTKIATIMADYDYETKEQVRECDVAEALKIDVADNFDLFVNSKTKTAENYQIVATDTVTKVGGTGRVTEFYYEIESKWFTDEVNVAVMIDTMLARVTDKHDAKLDPAGHVITPAKLEVTIYDGMDTTWDVANATTPDYDDCQSKRVISKPTSSKDNWDDYSKGDYILLHAYTNKSQNDTKFYSPDATATDADLGNNIVRDTQDLKESAAFQTNKVVNGTLWAGGINQNVWVEQKAESKQGKQTVTYWNQNKHQVDGTDYNDQICLFLDKAGNITNTTFTWFFDLYGNIIGIGDAHSTNYGIITNVYAAFGQGEADTNGNVKAIASVKYTDGTTGTVEIDRFLMTWNSTADDLTTPGSTSAEGDLRVVPSAGTKITQSNSQVLWPVYDTINHAPLTAMNADVTAVANNNPGTDHTSAWLYMAPSTVTNYNAHFGTNSDSFRILYDTLFEFSVADDNTVVATEVAGAYTTAGVPDNTSANFSNKANAVTNAATGKLYKSLGYIDVPSANANYVYLTNDTQILVRLNNLTGTTVNAYTLETLPGNVDIGNGDKVSWADVDGDNRADYVYIQGGEIPSTLTYGLFYTDGSAAQWDAATNSGTIAGYLNGEPETITIKGTTNKRNIFDVINRNTLSNGDIYQAKLYALQFTNGEVTDLMVAENKTSASNRRLAQILSSEADATPGENVTGVVLDLNGASNAPANRASNIQLSSETWDGTNVAASTKWTQMFGLGSAFGNPYTATTEAVYYHDTNSSAGAATSLNYVVRSGGDWIEVRTGGTASTSPADTVYWLAPNVKIYGELDWLNRGYECYVTMVYDAANANAVTEIYITHDPDVTPDDDSVKAGTPGIGVTTLPKISNDAALTAAIKGSGPNTVVYSPEASTNLAGVQSKAPQFLYFPFTTGGTAENPVVLTIRDANGDVVFQESSGKNVAANTTTYFVINFASGTSTPATTYVANVLTAGAYSYKVVGTTTGATLSEGTFTMN